MRSRGDCGDAGRMNDEFAARERDSLRVPSIEHVTRLQWQLGRTRTAWSAKGAEPGSSRPNSGGPRTSRRCYARWKPGWLRAARRDPLPPRRPGLHPPGGRGRMVRMVCGGTELGADRGPQVRPAEPRVVKEALPLPAGGGLRAHRPQADEARAHRGRKPTHSPRQQARILLTNDRAGLTQTRQTGAVFKNASL